MSSKTKPCWFCGSDNTDCLEIDYHLLSSEYYCYCDNCEAQGPMADTEKAAIRRWNEPHAKGAKDE